MQTILLLHGALGSSEQLLPLKALLEQKYEVLLFNFQGHGGKASTGDFSIPGFAAEVAAFLEGREKGDVEIFGYSMGGYVALYLSLHYPALVKKVFTLGTKFNWTPESAEKEAAMLQPEKVAEKVPHFAEQLRLRHAPADWRQVMQRTAAMMLDLGSHPTLSDNDFKSIKIPVLLMVGDRDKMVSIEETTGVYRLIPGSKMAVLPSTAHAIEQVDLKDICYFIEK